MKKIILIIILPILLGSITSESLAQKGFPKYYEFLALYNKADSLQKAKKYVEAAELFNKASFITIEKGVDYNSKNVQYQVAINYTLAGKYSKAFNALRIFIYETEYSDYDALIKDDQLKILQSKKEWWGIVEMVRRNQLKNTGIEKSKAIRLSIPENSNEYFFHPLTNYAKGFLQNDSLALLSLNYKNFRIYTRSGSYALNNFSDLKRELDAAYLRSLEVLNINHYPRGINVLLVDSPGELEEITDMFVRGGFAAIGHDLVCLPMNANRRIQLRHELFHLVANEVWGSTASRLLNEGSAVYADNICYIDDPIHKISKKLLLSQKLFAIDELINNFDQKAYENDVVAYLQSASIFKFLYEKYGIEKMKILWKDGFQNFEKIYGISIGDLEKNWLEYINSIDTKEDLDINKLLEEGCG